VIVQVSSIFSHRSVIVTLGLLISKHNRFIKLVNFRSIEET